MYSKDEIKITENSQRWAYVSRKFELLKKVFGSYFLFSKWIITKNSIKNKRNHYCNKIPVFPQYWENYKKKNYIPTTHRI